MANESNGKSLKRKYEHDICMIPYTDAEFESAKKHMIENRAKWGTLREEGKKVGTWTEQQEWSYNMEMGKGVLAFISSIVVFEKSNPQKNKDSEIFKAHWQANIRPLYTELFSGYEYNAHEMAVIVDKLKYYSELEEVDMNNITDRELIRTIIDTDLIIRINTKKLRDSTDTDDTKVYNTVIKDASNRNRQARIDIGIMGKENVKEKKEKTLREKEEKERQGFVSGIMKQMGGKIEAKPGNPVEEAKLVAKMNDIKAQKE